MQSSQGFSRNIRLFYTHQFLVGLSTLWAPIIVIFQMQEIGLSLTQVMIGESTFAASIVLLEVPSGVFADRMGRKSTLIAGMMFFVTGMIIFAFASNFAQVIISQMLFGVGSAFRSGADSALLFDSLKAVDRETEYQKVLGRSQTIGYLTAIPMNITGGLIAARFGFRLTIALSAGITALNLINFFLLAEPPMQEQGKRPGKTALWHTWKALRYIWKHRIVRFTIAFAMIFGIGMKLSFHTLNPYWELWQVPISYFGFALAGYNLVAAVTSHYAYRIIRKLGDLRTLLLMLLLICGTFFIMAGLSLGIAGALLIPAVFQISRSLQPIATDDMVNRVTFSHHRATVLSMKSFLRQVAQIALLPVFGIISDSFGLLTAYGWTATFIGVFGLSALYRLYVLPTDYQHGNIPIGIEPKKPGQPSIKAVIFDMDGVIIDSHSVSQQLLIELGERLDIDFDQEDIKAWQGSSGPDFWRYIKQKYELQQPVEYYLTNYDVSEKISRYAELSPINGVLELIDDLRSHGVKLALATNGWKVRMDAVLEIFNLQSTFEITLCSDDVNNAKPHPEIFLLTAQRLGVPAESCVVIEDSVDGIIAAKQAGMFCVAFKGLAHVDQDVDEADLIIKDFCDLTYRQLVDAIVRT